MRRLTSKKVAEKRLAITVFSFPPDKGNVGTAAYLNVFGSIFRVLQDLQREGYNVGEIPADEKALMEKVGLSCKHTYTLSYPTVQFTGRAPLHITGLLYRSQFHQSVCRAYHVQLPSLPDGWHLSHWSVRALV